MHQSDTLGWIRVVLLLAVVVFVIGYSAINPGTATPEKPTTQPQETTETTPETQEATEPTYTIPTQEETTPQTEPPTTAPAPPETEKPTEAAPTTSEPTRATEPTTEQAPPQTQPATGSWQSLGTYKLTAYCSCKQCCGKEPGDPGYGITATGATAVAGTTIAVDPRVIPYGSSVKVNDLIYMAQDTGGAINGNRIDVYFDDHQDALIFGVQIAEVFIKTEAA